MRHGRGSRALLVAFWLLSVPTWGQAPSPSGALPSAPPTPLASERTSTMRAVFQALMGLQPYLASPSRFRDPKNAQSIGQLLAVMTSLKHAFPGDATAQDPGTAAIANLFDGYLGEAKVRFDAGERATVVYRVRTATQLCFGCHSRLSSEKDFDDAAKQIDTLPLTPLERADFLAATRQFDRALALYRDYLSSLPEGERGLIDYGKALRNALNILVRVKRDARAAAELVEAVAKQEQLPTFLRAHLAGWRKDIAAWSKDRFDPTKSSGSALLAKAGQLVKSAQGERGFLPDQNEDVLFLRASNYLHEALAKEPRLPNRSEALYLLGVCAGALQSPTLFELDQLYFEACIRESPHSPVARRCFGQLSERVYLGYTGSSGTHLPDDEVRRLAELRELSR